MFYTLIKHGFLTNQSARKVLSIFLCSISCDSYGFRSLQVPTVITLLFFRDTCIALLKLLPSSENHLIKSCARCQGTVTEVNELHEKVT